jgi:hypothetical protein
MWYKRKIQNRKIQSKRVLGLTKYTHRLSDHNKVALKDFFVENAHWKSKGALILRTISRHNTIFCHNQKTDTTTQVYCTLSTYVIPKTISHQNQKANTMPQLYCTLDMYVSNTKIYFPPETTKLTQQHSNWKKSSSSPRAASVFVPPSFRPWVSKG